MTDRGKARLGLLLRLAAGLGLLFLAVRGLDWRHVGEALSQVNWFWTTAALASVLLSLGLKAVRWQYLLKGAVPQAQWPNLFGALLAGQATNIVLPVRGGEVARALLVSPPEASRVGILAAIGVEKVFDLAAVTVLTVGWLPSVLVLASTPEAARYYPAWTGAAASLAGAFGLWAVVRWGERIWGRARRVLERRVAPGGWPGRGLAFGLRWGDEVLVSLRPLRSTAIFLGAVGLTVIIWANMLATNLLLFVAFGLKMPLLAGVGVLVLIHIGLLPAVMPGNIGPFYFFTEVALQPFAVPPAAALSYAVLLHLLVTLPPLLGGGVFLLASRRRPADSRAA